MHFSLKKSITETREASIQKFVRQVQYDRRQSFTGPIRTNRIRLHIYDLIPTETVVQLPWGMNFPIGSCFNVVNNSLHQLGTGAYHVGIEVRSRIRNAAGLNHTFGRIRHTCISPDFFGTGQRS